MRSDDGERASAGARGQVVKSCLGLASSVRSSLVDLGVDGRRASDGKDGPEPGRGVVALERLCPPSPRAVTTFVGQALALRSQAGCGDLRPLCWYWASWRQRVLGVFALCVRCRAARGVLSVDEGWMVDPLDDGCLKIGRGLEEKEGRDRDRP